MTLTDETPYCVRIVEDSTVLAEMLGVVLDFEGIRWCVTTENFEVLLTPECWERVTTALCDLDLGGPITGEMVLEYLRDRHPWIKRVVLSAVSDVSSPRIIALAHVTMAKPVELSRIVDAIR